MTANFNAKSASRVSSNTEADDHGSAIYECQVMHHRLKPKEHRFDYRVFYLWLDLDELESLSGRLRLFKRNRAALFSFFDADHILKGGANVNSKDKDGTTALMAAAVRVVSVARPAT